MHLRPKREPGGDGIDPPPNRRQGHLEPLSQAFFLKRSPDQVFPRRPSSAVFAEHNARYTGPASETWGHSSARRTSVPSILSNVDEPHRTDLGPMGAGSSLSSSMPEAGSRSRQPRRAPASTMPSLVGCRTKDTHRRSKKGSGPQPRWPELASKQKTAPLTVTGPDSRPDSGTRY